MIHWENSSRGFRKIKGQNCGLSSYNQASKKQGYFAEKGKLTETTGNYIHSACSACRNFEPKVNFNAKHSANAFPLIRNLENRDFKRPALELLLERRRDIGKIFSPLNYESFFCFNDLLPQKCTHTRVFV